MVVAHRTLYARTETKGKTRWLRLFWACTGCNRLNHVIVPAYGFQRIAAELPTPLAVGVVEALRERPLNFDELVMTLRRGCPGVRHVFNSDVMMVLEYLVRRGIVARETKDVTERSLGELRAKTSDSRHLALCPAETNSGAIGKSLVSVYSQRRIGAIDGRPAASKQKRLTPAGVLCLRCGYHRIDLR
ncbi:MAG: hypothetical protein JRN58_01895 [Nitrososphaerota archaeon]|nr:hypothetical protein [Nitrososphaerota archaeon]